MEQEIVSGADSGARAGPVGEADGAPSLTLEERRFYSEKLLTLVDDMERIYGDRVQEVARSGNEIDTLSGENDELAGENDELAGLLDRLVAIVERSLETDGWDAAHRAIETLAALLDGTPIPDRRQANEHPHIMTDRTIKTDSGKTDLGKTDPGQTDPGQTDPGQTDPGQTDPGDTDPGSSDPGDTGFGRAGSHPFRDVSVRVLEEEFQDEDGDARPDWPESLRDGVTAFLRDMLNSDRGAGMEIADALSIVPSFAAGVNQRLTIALDPDSAYRAPDISINESDNEFELRDPDEPAAPPPTPLPPVRGDPLKGITSADPDDPFMHFHGDDPDAPPDGADPGISESGSGDIADPPVLEFPDTPGDDIADAIDDDDLFDKFTPQASDAAELAPESSDLDIPAPGPVMESAGPVMKSEGDGEAPVLEFRDEPEAANSAAPEPSDLDIPEPEPEPAEAEAEAGAPVLEFQDVPEDSGGPADGDDDDDDDKLFEKFAEELSGTPAGAAPDAGPARPDIKELVERLHAAAERARGKLESAAAKAPERAKPARRKDGRAA